MAPELAALLLVATVDEPVGRALRRVLHWATLVWGAGVDEAPLALVHDVGFALLRGHGLRLCGGRERARLDGILDDEQRARLRGTRLRFEDRVLTTLLRDPSVQAAHIVIAGTPADGQDAVVAHALTSVLPRVLAGRRWPAQQIGHLRAAVESADDNDDNDDVNAFVAAVDVGDLAAAADVLDAVEAPVSPVLAPEALWELARLDVVPSEAARLALRTVHKTMAALPAPSSSLLSLLKDRRHEVTVEDDHAADEFPAGGFDAMSTRGILENLVRSEVAYVGVGAEDSPGAPDLFDVRFVEGELLYYTRDESPLLQRRRQLTVLIEEVPRLRHKLVELPTQTLVLCEACVLRAFSDLQQALGASAVTLRLAVSGDDDDVVSEERGVLATSLMSEIAHRRAAIVVPSELPTAGRVTFSPRPPPSVSTKRNRALWVRVGGPTWTVTTSKGEVIEVEPRDGLRDVVDLLMLMA